VFETELFVIDTVSEANESKVASERILRREASLRKVVLLKSFASHYANFKLSLISPNGRENFSVSDINLLLRKLLLFQFCFKIQM